MKKVLIRSFSVAIVLVILALLFLPAYVEKSLNKVVTKPPYEVSAKDSELCKSLPFIADLHSDALLWGRDLNKRVERGHVDIPRMIEANVALQAFTIVSKTPKNQNYDSNSDQTDNVTALMVIQGRHPRTWMSLLERGLDMCSRLSASAKTNDDFRIIHSSAELRTYLLDRKNRPAQTAGMLGVEGLHLLEGELSNLNKLYDAGVRMVAPVHFFDNEIGGSAHGVGKGGLTPFGKTVLAEAEKRNMIIDLSHGSNQLISDILDVATRPVIVSHTGLRALCAGDRNLTDEQLIRIAENRGLVGIAMFEEAVCSQEIKATAEAIKHASEVMGLQHVALGSDFDGAVMTPFDVTGLPLLVIELRELGFSESDIAAIMGGNVRDFLIANLPPN